MAPFLDFKDIVSYPIVFTPILVLLVSYLCARHYVQIKYDPREPPIVPHPIPYVGHIIDIFRHGARYFEGLE